MKLEFPSQLGTGEARLVLEYTGKLNDQMRGFYRSKYTDPNSPGTEKYAATTQFEVHILNSFLYYAPSCMPEEYSWLLLGMYHGSFCLAVKLLIGH